jgi:hypothetical protein
VTTHGHRAIIPFVSISTRARVRGNAGTIILASEQTFSSLSLISLGLDPDDLDIIATILLNLRDVGIVDSDVPALIEREGRTYRTDRAQITVVNVIPLLPSMHVAQEKIGCPVRPIVERRFIVGDAHVRPW